MYCLQNNNKKCSDYPVFNLKSKNLRPKELKNPLYTCLSNLYVHKKQMSTSLITVTKHEPQRNHIKTTCDTNLELQGALKII